MKVSISENEKKNEKMPEKNLKTGRMFWRNNLLSEEDFIMRHQKYLQQLVQTVH